MELRTRPVGDKQMNTYVLICPRTRQSVLFDPGAEPDTLLQLLDGTTPTALILTHTHRDHVGALDEMRERLNVPLLAPTGPRQSRGVEVEADRWIAGGDTVEVGDHRLLVLHTPGHSPDMLSFLIEDDHRAIVGDTLFDGGPGRTWEPQEFQTTLHTLRTIVLSWPDDTVCYPGHGPAFRLGDRRKDIEDFLRKDFDNFYGDATWDIELA
jgi:glyoxylase-like metal-dependent hydrolase (beta-lactamase superfamily II)